jgi:hypothetical protein
MTRLSFKRVPFEGVTVMYVVSSGEVEVGRISWWSPWRRYVLHTQDEIIFDADCLKEVADFLTALMLKRKVSYARRDLRSSWGVLCNENGTPRCIITGEAYDKLSPIEQKAYLQIER